MGCPSPAIGRFGAGVILMERPEAARRIVAEARKRTDLPLSVKIRLGSDSDSRKLKTFCSMLPPILPFEVPNWKIKTDISAFKLSCYPFLFYLLDQFSYRFVTKISLSIY